MEERLAILGVVANYEQLWWKAYLRWKALLPVVKKQKQFALSWETAVWHGMLRPCQASQASMEGEEMASQLVDPS